MLLGIPFFAARNSLFHPIGSQPAEGPGSEGVRLTAAALLAAVGQLAMTEGFRFLPISIGGAFQILLPLTITISGVVLFKETFTAGQIGGAALILLGCYQTVMSKTAPTPRVRTH